MFLYAKLVLKNVMEQPNREKAKLQMYTGQAPSGLSEA
jgi:hypothetical protein